MDQDINRWTIYMYTFPNGKRYIGATTRSLSQRRGVDWSKYKRNKILTNAIQEFGIDNIVQTVLFEGLMENRIAAEIESFFIEAYKTNVNRYNNPSYGYNQTDGGEGTTKKHLSDERRAFLREQIKSLSIDRLGSHPSEEVRRRQSEAQWKKRGPIPLEIRKDRANKRKEYNSINGVKKVPHKISVVVHNTLTGETLRYPSISATANHYGMRDIVVSEIINGRKTSPSGYIFVKEDDADKSWKITDINNLEESKSYEKSYRAVILHDPKTNETMRFESVTSFCKYFQVFNVDKIKAWLTGKEIMPLGLIFTREEDGIPAEWNPVSVTAEEIEAGDTKYHLKNYLRKTRKSKQPIIIHNPSTGETLHFDSVTEAAVYYGICYETISRWLTGVQKPSNGVIVIKESELDSSLNWDVKHIEVEKPRKKQSHITPIIMHNENTNETFSFKSIKDAAYFLDVTENTLTRWLWGERRPPEGYVFVRKEDLDPALGWEIKEVH